MRKFTKYPSNYVDAASETSGAATRRRKREFEQKAKEGIELMVSDGDWEVWTPKTWEGSCYLGGLYSDTQAFWDTCAISGNPRWFDMYNERGPLYVIVNRNTGEKYQAHFETDSFYDEKDHNIGGIDGLHDFCIDKPGLYEFFFSE